MDSGDANSARSESDVADRALTANGLTSAAPKLERRAPSGRMSIGEVAGWGWGDTDSESEVGEKGECGEATCKSEGE